MPPGSDRNVVFWFRRDLRLADQPALTAALDAARSTGGRVLPLFVLDEQLSRPSGVNRLAFRNGCLRALRTDSVPLVIRSGEAVRTVSEVAEEVGAVAVFCTGDFAPYGRDRDAAVGAALARAGRRLVPLDSPYAVAPGVVRKQDATPYKVFTPYRRGWLEALGSTKPRPTIDARTIDWLTAEGADVPVDPPGVAPLLPTAGERAAEARLSSFLAEHLHAYGQQRNDPAADATSRLSPDLKFGTLHTRQILDLLPGGGPGTATFRSELCWREFYADVLWHRPDSARHAFVDGMEAMQVDEGRRADDHFIAWCEGRTGYPFVDAGMRQLLAEGWMHNRVRMATASFLVKDLHLDWRRGARWFMQHLVDGDIASNQHGWQWTAGTGTDAAPYFRVFNPTSQGKKFDPDGTYVRRYVPELTGLADGDIHEPWKAGGGGLFGCVDGYPAPIVDHAVEREEALRRYAAVRGR